MVIPFQTEVIEQLAPSSVLCSANEDYLNMETSSNIAWFICQLL